MTVSIEESRAGSTCTFTCGSYYGTCHAWITIGGYQITSFEHAKKIVAKHDWYCEEFNNFCPRCNQKRFEQIRSDEHKRLVERK